MNPSGFCDHCELSATKTPTFILPDIIRRSHIEMYKSCPYSFYLAVKAGTLKHNNEEESENEGESIYALLGRDLHVLFDRACMDRSYLKEDMLKQFHGIWYTYDAGMFESEVFKVKMYDRAIASINNFYERLVNLPYSPFITEENLIHSIDENLPNVSITMDRIDEVGGELEMHDWKTGKVMVGKKLASDLQAPLYIWMVKQTYAKPVRSFTFHYLSENKTRVFERVNDDEYRCTVLKNEYTVSLTETIREIKSLFSRMKNGDFNIPSSKSNNMFFTCKMCTFRKAGQCAGADEQSWIQINQNRGEAG